jgi:hypothetical protein
MLKKAIEIVNSDRAFDTKTSGITSKVTELGQHPRGFTNTPHSQPAKSAQPWGEPHPRAAPAPPWPAASCTPGRSAAPAPTRPSCPDGHPPGCRQNTPASMPSSRSLPGPLRRSLARMSAVWMMQPMPRNYAGWVCAARERPKRPFDNSPMPAIWRAFLRFRCSRTKPPLRAGSRKTRQLTRPSEFSNGLGRRINTAAPRGRHRLLKAAAGGGSIVYPLASRLTRGSK